MHPSNIELVQLAPWVFVSLVAEDLLQRARARSEGLRSDRVASLCMPNFPLKGVWRRLSPKASTNACMLVHGEGLSFMAADSTSARLALHNKS